MSYINHKQIPETNKISSLKTQDRYTQALEEAKHSFWAVIAKAFPEAEHGDFSPDASFKFDQAVEQGVDIWLWTNYPTVRSLLIREAKTAISKGYSLEAISKLDQVDSAPDDEWENYQDSDGNDLRNLETDED